MTKQQILRIYRDKKKQLRWTFIARNGRKLANGGEGYKRIRDLEKALALVFGGGWIGRTDIKAKDETGMIVCY